MTNNIEWGVVWGGEVHDLCIINLTNLLQKMVDTTQFGDFILAIRKR